MAETIIWRSIQDLRSTRTLTQEEVDAAAARSDARDFTPADRRPYMEGRSNG